MHIIPAICCCTDILAKCKDVTDPNLATAVNKIKETVKSCPCGLKYKDLADMVAVQTRSTGASNTCAPEMQKIIEGLRARAEMACVRAKCPIACTI